MPPRERHSRPSSLALAPGIRFTFLGFVGYLILRAIVGLHREVVEYRASAAQLETVWATIPGVVTERVLRMRARASSGRSEGMLPPMVLVHGFGIASSYFVPLAARLSRHADVYAPELPGHGRSVHDARPLEIPELARALAAWMDAMALQRVVLIGHSMGCQIVAEMAWRHPDRVAGILMIGPTADPAARTVLQQLGRLAVTWLFERPGLAVLLLIDYTRAGLHVLCAERQSMQVHHLEEVLPRLHAPAQVVRGARDAVAPQSWTETVSRLLAAPPPIVIPGWGHAVHYDDPAAVADVSVRLARRAVARGIADRAERMEGSR